MVCVVSILGYYNYTNLTFVSSHEFRKTASREENASHKQPIILSIPACSWINLLMLGSRFPEDECHHRVLLGETAVDFGGQPRPGLQRGPGMPSQQQETPEYFPGRLQGPGHTSQSPSFCFISRAGHAWTALWSKPAPQLCHIQISLTEWPWKKSNCRVWMAGIKIECGLHIYRPPTSIHTVNQALALCRNAFR